MSPEMADGIIGSALYELAIARGAVAALDADMAKVYIRDLHDLDAEIVERACRDLGKEPREDFEPAMPPVGSIRQRVKLLVREDEDAHRLMRLAPPPSPGRHPDEPVYFCLECKDETSAWAPRWCQGIGEQRVIGPGHHGEKVEPCGRTKDHYPHPFAVRCGCFETNPVSAKRREKENVRRAEQDRKRRGDRS